MVEAAMLWNEPNNKSHWAFEHDPDWKIFSDMTALAAECIKSINPNLPCVLGGISPIDANFVRLLDGHKLLDRLDVVAVHGFPLDWNHWTLHEWPS